ncbi:MAG: hypothetical protein CVU44_21770 [Chloroflexi bacterium HGW-Chloroflexi-6]|nr:MAG: hypothetical protein CVU44_21770 [Chloroflexi bacterium HGW-Chloroflexi-6]
MQNEFISQYAHTWRVFTRLVNDFDDEAWLHTGRDATTPARLSFHILKSTKYYLGDLSDMKFRSGKSFEMNGQTAAEDELPSRNDILHGIDEYSRRTETWLSELDFMSANDGFPWAGKTKLALVIFLLRHSLYHLGELSCLLNESRNGNVEDNYVRALEGNL